MLNIYDYFYSKEVADKFVECKHEFNFKEMTYVIFYSFKPLNMKIEGLKQISNECNDKELKELISKLLESYEELAITN